MNHIVALSGGKDSCATAFKLKELHPEYDPYYVCTPTGSELPEMKEHWANLECMLGKKLTNVTDLTMRDLIRKHNMLPNWRARFCTVTIKIHRFQKWLTEHTPATVYIGLRADEEDREGGIYDSIPNVEVRFPLRELGMEKKDVIAYCQGLGIKIPQRTDCYQCFFQTMSEWWRLWKDYPELFEEAVQDEVYVSAVRGKKCTFRNEHKDKWATSLADLRAEFESGKIPKNYRGIPANQTIFDMEEERDGMCSFCAR